MTLNQRITSDWGEELDRIRERAPLVHCVTNYVTVEACANILLAVGASPIMADDVREVAEITSLCSALVLNLGTLNEQTIPAMFAAGREANELGCPIILDPTGAGASRLRTETASQIMEELRPSVLRGNISEIKAMMAENGIDVDDGMSGTTRGVDAGVADLVTEKNQRGVAKTLALFARKMKTVVGVSGPIDIITDGEQTVALGGGDPIMTKVTGCGCMLSALVGAFAAVGEPWLATSAAFAVMNHCGEEVARRTREANEGPMAFRRRLIDEIYSLDSALLKAQYVNAMKNPCHT